MPLPELATLGPAYVTHCPLRFLGSQRLIWHAVSEHGRLVVMNDPIDSDMQQPSEAAQLQFGLPVLFYIMTLYAVGLVFDIWTIALTTLVLVFWWMASDIRVRFWFWLWASLVLAMITLLLLPVGQIRESSRRTECLNRVRQLTLAMHNYESNLGRFPAAYLKDEAGKPIHSWRVAILPYMEYQNLFAQYDFDEPWNGPNNIAMLDQMPSVFTCPSHRNHLDCTPYKLVVDKMTAFENGRSPKVDDFTDGISNTVSIVEDSGNLVPWTKPEDLTIEQAIDILVPADPSAVAHFHRYEFTTYLGSNISLMDASTWNVGPKVSPELIRSICLCADGQVIDRTELLDSGVVYHWEKFIALATYIILLLLPGVLLVVRKCNKRRLLGVTHP